MSRNHSTTLARQIAATGSGPVTVFDLEHPGDVARLAEPMLALEGLTGLVVIDEVQRRAADGAQSLAATPPSILMVSPLMKRDCSDARNSARLATSSG